MVLDGALAPASVQLFTETSVTFDEVLFTAAHRPLRWGATPTYHHVDLELTFRPWRQAEQTLTSRVACDALRLAPADFAESSFVDLRRGRARVPVGDEPLEVRAEPEGPVKLALPVPRHSVDVVLLEKQASMRRIATVVAPHLWLVGWVPSRRLVIPSGGHGQGCGVGGGRLGRRAWYHTSRCDQPIPLYVQLGSERAVVGQLRPRTPFHQRGGRDEGFTAITPDETDVRLRAGAEWLVDDASLEAHCTRR